jgi:hypothetical protein
MDSPIPPSVSSSVDWSVMSTDVAASSAENSVAPSVLPNGAKIREPTAVVIMLGMPLGANDHDERVATRDAAVMRSAVLWGAGAAHRA